MPIGEIDVSEEGVLFRSLVFLESMLNQIMDIKYTKNGSYPLFYLILFISSVLKNPCMGTAVKEITCHILDQLMRKLEIPIYEELSPEPPDLQTIRGGRRMPAESCAVLAELLC